MTERVDVGWSDEQIAAVRVVWPMVLPMPSDEELRTIVVAVNSKPFKALGAALEAPPERVSENQATRALATALADGFREKGISSIDAAASLIREHDELVEENARLRGEAPPEPPLYVYHGPHEGMKLLTFPELPTDRAVVLTPGDKLELRWVRGEAGPAPIYCNFHRDEPLPTTVVGGKQFVTRCAQCETGPTLDVSATIDRGLAEGLLVKSDREWAGPRLDETALDAAERAYWQDNGVSRHNLGVAILAYLGAVRAGPLPPNGPWRVIDKNYGAFYVGYQDREFGACDGADWTQREAEAVRDALNQVAAGVRGVVPAPPPDSDADFAKLAAIVVTIPAQRRDDPGTLAAMLYDRGVRAVPASQEIDAKFRAALGEAVDLRFPPPALQEGPSEPQEKP